MSLFTTLLYGAIAYVAVRLVAGFFDFDPFALGQDLAETTSTTNVEVSI